MVKRPAGLPEGKRQDAAQRGHGIPADVHRAPGRCDFPRQDGPTVMGTVTEARLA